MDQLRTACDDPEVPQLMLPVLPNHEATEPTPKEPFQDVNFDVAPETFSPDSSGTELDSEAERSSNNPDPDLCAEQTEDGPSSPVLQRSSRVDRKPNRFMY